MCGDDPVLADDALDGVQLAFLVFSRRVGGDVDVVAVIEEHGLLVRGRQVAGGRLVQVERLGDVAGVDLRAPVEVDPQQLVAAEPNVLIVP